MKTFVRKGNLLDYTNSSGSTISSGAVVVLTAGNSGGIAVAEDDILNGAVGAVRNAGVVTLPALSTDTGTQLTTVYWDATNTRITTTNTSNTFAGKLAAPKVNGDTTVQVLLNGMPASN